MFYNTKQFYTPALEPYELEGGALIIDTETVGSGPLVEIIEIALGDMSGKIIYQTLVRPLFNPLPQPSKHRRFERAELTAAPDWPSVWPTLSSLIEGRLLIAYNAAFDRRALAATCSRYQHKSLERGWRCAMQLVKQTTGTRKSLTLEEACALYGLEAGNHRAARDVEATYRLLGAVIDSKRASRKR